MCFDNTNNWVCLLFLADPHNGMQTLRSWLKDIRACMFQKLVNLICDKSDIFLICTRCYVSVALGVSFPFNRDEFNLVFFPASNLVIFLSTPFCPLGHNYDNC